MSYQAIWREPAEESTDLYPGLVVHDNRVSGSITVGPQRLAFWYFIGDVIRAGWFEAVEEYGPFPEGYTAEDAASFFYDLMEHRGEFGRLLLVLADAHRRERERAATESANDRPWWEEKAERTPVVLQLHRCLDALTAAAVAAGAPQAGEAS